jgi:hypothetical protein
MKSRIMEVSIAFELQKYSWQPYQLEDELAAQPPPAKRARKSATSATDDASNDGPSTSTAASTKADEKKKKVQLKKIFDQYARTSFLTNVITHELN